jgi:hypothetical protein
MESLSELTQGISIFVFPISQMTGGQLASVTVSTPSTAMIVDGRGWRLSAPHEIDNANIKRAIPVQRQTQFLIS